MQQNQLECEMTDPSAPTQGSICTLGSGEGFCLLAGLGAAPGAGQMSTVPSSWSHIPRWGAEGAFRLSESGRWVQRVVSWLRRQTSNLAKRAAFVST